MEIQTTEPTTITAGDTIRWTKALADYPAELYALKYRLALHTGGASIELTATASGSEHSLTISAADSAGYTPGDYRWVAFATDIATGLERYTVADGRLTILADPAATTASDSRSHARKVLAAIEAVLEGSASIDQQRMTVDGDSLERRPIVDLLTLRSRYAQEVRREEAAERLAKGLQSSNIIRTRFI